MDTPKITLSFECDGYQAALLIAAYELLSVSNDADYTVWQEVSPQTIDGLVCLTDEIGDWASEIVWTLVEVCGQYESLEKIPRYFQALARLSGRLSDTPPPSSGE